MKCSSLFNLKISSDMTSLQQYDILLVSPPPQKLEVKLSYGGKSNPLFYLSVVLIIYVVI